MKAIRFGLIARIALLVVGVEIAAFGALGWFYVDRFSAAADEQARSRLRLVGRMIANDELAVSVVSRQSLMRELVHAPYLDGMVIGGNGRVIVSTDATYLGRPAGDVPGFDARWIAESAADEQFIARDGTLTSVMQIRGASGGSPIYRTILTISTAELRAQKRSIALWGLIGSALFILLSSAAIILIAQRLITRRIHASLSILKQVEEGALDARIPIGAEDELGQLQAGINSMTDKLGALLNQHRLNAEELRKRKDLLASIIQHAPIRVFWKDRESRYVGCNRQFALDAGLADPDDLVGKTDHDMGWREQADDYRADDQAVMASGTPKLDFEEPQTTPDGRTIWLSTSKVPLRGEDGQIIGVLGIYTDITGRKQAEAQIHHLAYFDSLTGLANRTLLLDRLKQAMAASNRSGSFGALLLIDLDNFKALNDTLGHDMGDLLLNQVAQRLALCMRDSDTVARFGGDEFVVVLTGLDTRPEYAVAAAESAMKKILATLAPPFQLGNLPRHTTASIGITLFRGSQATVDDLMKQADLAMYESKAAGRNMAHFFDPSLEAAMKSRVALEDDLRQAIAENQFVLHYQPQMAGEGLTGAEVLVRWQHAKRGLVSPAEFIPLAEETGLILPLGLWVLETACARLALWAGRPEMAHLTVAVNISAYQFRQPGFVEQVLAVLKKTGASPRRLKLELTESLLVSDVEQVIEKMFALKAKGVGFSLDDFGTGYSSLSYLKRLPLDQLKIDQSFVRDVLVDANDASIARTIVALAQNLGLGVIAEGVETEAQRAFLAQLGCHAYQGYLFSRPLPIDGFEAFARRV